MEEDILLGYNPEQERRLERRGGIWPRWALLCLFSCWRPFLPACR